MPRWTCWWPCTRSRLPKQLPVEGRADYAIPSFDTDAMLIEVSLLLDWYLPDQRRRGDGGDAR